MKYNPYLGAFFLLILPHFTFAQSLQGFMSGLLAFVSGTLVPFLFGLAFLFFVFNIIKYLVLDGGNEEARDNAKNLALYGFGAFVFLVIFWGVVNLVVSATGLGGGQPVQSDYVTKTRTPATTGTTNTPPATSPTTETDDLDLSVDDIADDTPVDSTDSPAGCIQFSIDGICLDPAEDQTGSGDSLLGSRTQIITGLHEATGQEWQVLNIGTTQNSHYFTMRNLTNGRSVMLTYTAINGDMDNHTDYMVRLEEVREPGDTNETPPAWVTTRFVYNETNNNFEIFVVSNSTEYSRTYNGTAYMNQQGQFVMNLRDQYGQPYTATQNTWISDFIINGEVRPVRM